jgi:hypothetical protein
MAGKQFESEVLRFEEANVYDGDRRFSNRGQLNEGFVHILEQHKSKYGGGGCTRDTEHPIGGAAEMFLTGYDGDSPADSTVFTTEIELSEGDAATIRTFDNEFRVKFFGLSIERPSSDRVRNNQSAYVAIDVWDGDDGLWKEVEFQQGFNEPLEWTYPQGGTLRIVVDSAPGQDAEQDFKWLIEEGLSPAEALDYWMVEVMNETQANWASHRNKTRQAISKNVQSAKSKL